MKKIFRGIGILTSFTMLLSLCPNINLINVKANVSKGGVALEKLVQEYKNSGQGTMQDNHSKTMEKYIEINESMELEDGTGKYQEGYSGAYINGNDDLVVLMNEAYVGELTQENNDVIIEQCEYSINELQGKYETMKLLFDKWEHLYNVNKLSQEEVTVFTNVQDYYISVMDNNIIVSVINLDSEIIKLMDIYLDNKGIIIYQECKEDFVQEATTLKLGQLILCYSGGTYWRGSIGIKAYYVDSNGKKGSWVYYCWSFRK